MKILRRTMIVLATVLFVSLGFLLQPCRAQETGSVAKISYSDWQVKIDFLLFDHEKLVMQDYYFNVEFSVPSVDHYDATRIGPCRYLEQIPDVEFPIEESWIGLEAKITISAVWHADDFLIDINPNRSDGPWFPYWKPASALVIQYTIGETRTVYADGNNDGFVDLLNDARITTEITTVPEFTTALFLSAFAAITMAIAITKKRK